MTYKQLVNNVLKRLRERQVGTVEQNTYSTLIGMLVNDAKEEVENAWDWSALRTTLSLNTTSGVFNYELNGTQNRFKVLDVINDTSNFFMDYQTTSDFNNFYLNNTPASGTPKYYNFNGVSSDGDTLVDLYPKPDNIYAIRFNIIQRQADLVNDDDTLTIPSKAVEMLAYAKAIEERGEDGGISVSSQYAVAKQALADAIAIEAARRPDEETVWYPS